MQVRRVICHLQLDITHAFRTSLARLGKKNLLGCYLLSYLRTHQKKVQSIGTHCLPHFQVMLMGWSIQYCVLFSYRIVSKPSMQCCDGHTQHMGTTHSTWAPHTAHGHHTQHMGTTHSTFLEGHMPLLIMSERSRVTVTGEADDPAAPYLVGNLSVSMLACRDTAMSV